MIGEGETMGLILASASPRRRELMALAGLEFRVCVSDCDESVPDCLSPGEAAVDTARRKAFAVADRFPEDTVIGADTIVVIDGAILGKPKDGRDAASMLRRLSGRTHSVYTGVCVVSGGEAHSFCEKTDVTFYRLTEDEINGYIATGEPADKAGAYGIQGKGSLLVKSISGDYFNVVGLPISVLVRLLIEIGCIK